jgi:hypothetical protein
MAKVPPIAPLDPVPPLDAYPVMLQKMHQPVDEDTIGKRLESTVGRHST